MKSLSFITVCFNDFENLKVTVENVLELIDCDFDLEIEYFVIDGKSTDGTLAYLKSICGRIHWISEKDSGISDAFNKGIKMVDSGYIWLLNAGDTINKECFARFASFLNGSSCGLFFCDGFVEGKYAQSRPEKISEGMYVLHPGMVASKEVYDIVGMYNEKFKIAMDFDWLIRALVVYKVGWKTFGEPTVIIDKWGLSREAWLRGWCELLRVSCVLLGSGRIFASQKILLFIFKKIVIDCFRGLKWPM